MIRLGIDIGGTKINVGAFDDEKGLLANKKYYVSDVKDISDFIFEAVVELCEENSISYKKIVSCGVGVPGTVSGDGKKIIKVPNIDLITENFPKELEEKLSIPVGAVQDSRAAALGEYLFGGGRGKRAVVCVTLGTGIGTGIVLDGKIYHGSLGCAGELGHIPIVENGRLCGCGKRGCLEKYCAGKGLDVTAEELFGSGKKASDLFEEAEKGDKAARKALSEAAEMVGGALTSIINLLSPDCLLLSGGLSEREELYLQPIIEYVKEHCYKTDKLPTVKKAELGELSPLYGAAYIPIERKRNAVLSASIMCADVLNMGKALREIEEAGIEYLHCDIMDNHFVPNLMLPMDMLNKLRSGTDLPYDIHIMAEDPEGIIEKLTVKKNDIISVHFESTPHLKRVISKIKAKGAKVSVAINPATPVEVISEILPELDTVLVMTVNPGFAGQPLADGSLEKIRRMRKMLDERGYSDIRIAVDGNCSFENVPKMYESGAEIFVVGTSSVFKKGLTVAEGTKKLLSCLSV